MLWREREIPVLTKRRPAARVSAYGAPKTTHILVELQRLCGNRQVRNLLATAGQSKAGRAIGLDPLAPTNGRQLFRRPSASWAAGAREERPGWAESVGMLLRAAGHGFAIPARWRPWPVRGAGSRTVRKQPVSHPPPQQGAASPAQGEPSPLTDGERELLARLIRQGYVVVSGIPTCLTGLSEEDTNNVAEHLFCDRHGLFSPHPMEPYANFCSFGGLLRGIDVFERFKGEVIEPEYERLRDDLGCCAIPSPPGPAPVAEIQREFRKATALAGVSEDWATDADLLSLVRNESGLDPAAKNPTTSAFGLFQMLKSTWGTQLPEVPYGTANICYQAVGGFRYISQAYGTPTNAWSFWQATVRRDASLAPPYLRSKASEWIAKGWGGY